jgi:xanthine dehydrogenase small subunit
MRAAKIEAAIEGKSAAQITTDAIDDAIAQSFTARDGLRATWAYRSLVARNLVMQFVEEATTEGVAA